MIRSSQPIYKAVRLVVILSLVGCSSSSHLTIDSVIEDYLESYATGPNCLAPDLWWCDDERERPANVQLKPCTKLVVVRQTTNFNMGAGSHTNWPKDAVADLWRQREETNELRVKNAAHLPVVLIDEDEVQPLAPCTYFDLYPGAPKILGFSNIGFSSDGKSAVFVFSTKGWPGAIVGILAEWSYGRWRVVDDEAIEIY